MTKISLFLANFRLFLGLVWTRRIYEKLPESTRGILRKLAKKKVLDHF